MRTGDKGIDISRYDGTIDFSKVAKAGIKFCIPRDGAGFPNCHYAPLYTLDPWFLEYVEGCQKHGIDIIGVYHWIDGNSIEDAIKNADQAIANVQKANLPKSTVIWCDLEYSQAQMQHYGLTNAMLKKMTETFCNRILAEGYPTGVYTNQSYMAYVYGHDFGQHYDIWLADYEGEVGYDCLIRQTGSTGKVDGIDGNVDINEWYGKYTAGTAKTQKDDTAVTPTTSKTGKPFSKEYVRQALGVLDRPEGLEYINRGPYNCGYCHDDLHMSGDCWNINPKSTVWSLYLKDPISQNYTPRHYYYADGIKASGLPDETGRWIMDNACTETTFRKMISAGKAPCMLLIGDDHMGSYIGDFVRDGKTYNVSEFSPNSALQGKMRSYVDEYGRRLTHKGGAVIGTWNRCGYLTRYLDYSDWDIMPEPTPEPTPTEDDEVIKNLYLYKTEINLARQILADKWGNNPQRQEKITAKYGAVAYRIAQNFVNDISNGIYTEDELVLVWKIAKKIMVDGKFGTGKARRQKLTSKYGAKVAQMVQKLIDECYK